MARFKVGEEVYYVSSFVNKNEKVYGIIQHIGKLKGSGEKGCIWSDWASRKWDRQIIKGLDWMPKEKVYKEEVKGNGTE